MKVGLKLNWQIVINMTHVVDVKMFDNCFHVSMVGGLSYVVIRESDSKGYSDDKMAVDAKEYDRIQEELSRYLGVEIKDIEPELSIEKS